MIEIKLCCLYMEVCGLRCIVLHKMRYKVFKLSMKPCRMVLESMFLVLFVFSFFGGVTYIILMSLLIIPWSYFPASAALLALLSA